VFEHLIGEDDELSLQGGESEFFGFATSEDEAEVERSEDRVVAGGNERRQVKNRADLRTAAEDVALTAEPAMAATQRGTPTLTLKPQR
jgi:hypothetical protein